MAFRSQGTSVPSCLSLKTFYNLGEYFLLCLETISSLLPRDQTDADGQQHLPTRTDMLVAYATLESMSNVSH